MPRTGGNLREETPTIARDSGAESDRRSASTLSLE